MPPRFGGAPQCPRCHKSVYMAEQVIGPGGQWHKNCLTCIECNKRLDSTTLTEKNDEAYCKVCYGRKWGPKGYGFAGGAAFLSTESKLPSEILEEKKLLNTYQDDLPVKPQTTPTTKPPTLPPRPEIATPTRELSQSNREMSQSRDSYQSNRDISQSRESSKSNRDISQSTGSNTYVQHRSVYTPRKFNFQSQADTCTGCGKSVYAAELVLGAGNKYHKMCLRCCQCDKILDSTNMVDKDHDLYCRGCHSKAFGPKGYGYNNLLTSEGASR
ncbi:hypothetical protein BDB01DRAFT_842384 [Pilobolus umbonatus]|nr:hypothetical protein BDB01DRAFT_842384 [Pilobolus umbonatus]